MTPPDSESVMLVRNHQRKRNRVTFPAWISCTILVLCASIGTSVTAAEVSASQRRAAEELLRAAASGGAAALAPAIHPDELDLLRRRLVDQMKLEADRGESTTRTRLFGSGVPLAELERLTSNGFYAQLARRLRYPMREFEEFRWLQAVPDSGGMVHLVGRARQRRERGETRIPVLVSLVPWGKDWKAAVPLELQAQIEDLVRGRVGAAPAAAPPATSAEAATERAPAAQPAAIARLIDDAEAALQAKRCETYYEEHMSPNFRRATSSRALRALISACESRDEVRERLLAALRAVREGTPRYEYQGTRAVYDISHAGLPFQRFTLELVDRRWYVAD